ncbi:MAG: tRNA lysidine(34) synthetase TilS, partial [Bacteroidota bacterium]|nr:tRNA lysidine(34) synthetase TilS [Bacteroidota bacterium]
VAHCNFSLRGAESDGDEQFVCRLAAEHHLPLEQITFGTEGVAKEKGISIEMAARDLRYEWFNKMARKHSCKWIAVAHHRDDNAETFLLNLIRGSGIKGLTGMKPVSGNLIRPLLFASREEIASYAASNLLVHREDSTNTDTKYLRNKIRHEVLPLLETMNPSFRENLEQTIQSLTDVNAVFTNCSEGLIQSVISSKGEDTEVDLKKLKQINGWPALLFEFLRKYEFTPSVVNDIVRTIDGNSGVTFYSPAHVAVRDRERLIICRKTETVPVQEYIIREGQEEITEPLSLQLGIFDAEGYRIPRECSIASFDLDKITFPLVIRKWNKGDVFKPFGMKGFKKISDYFIDQKFSLPEKGRVWLVCSGNEIMWLAGYRTDDRFKITPETKKVFRIKITD